MKRLDIERKKKFDLYRTPFAVNVTINELDIQIDFPPDYSDALAIQLAESLAKEVLTIHLASVAG